MTEKQVFSDALSGRPSPVKFPGDGKLHGYKIQNLDLYNFHLYTTSSVLQLNAVRKISEEYDDYWVIEETLNPLFRTQYLFYKRRESAEEHIQELKKEMNNE